MTLPAAAAATATAPTAAKALGRLAWSLTLLLGLPLLVGWLDAGQRPAALSAAQAAYPPGAEAVQPGSLQRQDAGTIPMPAGAAAAHASSLLPMPLGHGAALTAFWFAGDRESAPNVQIAASQFERASQRWLPARYVVDRHAMAAQLGFGIRRLGNPVAWLDADGRVHLFVVATGWGGWAASRVLHLVQRGPDNRLDQLAFEPLRVLPLSWLWNTSYLVRNQPLPLQDGGMLLPVHFELGIKYPVALRFDRHGNWLGLERMSQRKTMLQAALLAQTPTEWVALMRNQQPDAHVTVVQTRNAGVQWSDAPDLALTNPDAAVAGLSLSAGQHLLAHNSSPHSRNRLDLSTATDARHWTLLAPLAQGAEADEFSYPALAWSDGALWVSYTDQRRSIAWQRFAPVASQTEPPAVSEAKPQP